jgi:hypothetical protein
MRTTSIKLEEDVYTAWKRSGIKLSQVVRMGLMNLNQTPGYVGRIKELEDGNEKLQRKITILMTRVNELERAE